MPALAGGDDVECGRWLSRFFGRGGMVVDADSGLDIQEPCLFELGFSDIERSYGAASLSELAVVPRRTPRSSGKTENMLNPLRARIIRPPERRCP